MKPDRPSPVAELRDDGLALADALLESNRPMNPLPDAVHARVKRRLVASAKPRRLRRGRWLQPAVIGGALLICGVAFGVAIDRLVLRHSEPSRESPPRTVPVQHSRASKAKATSATGRDVLVGEAPTPVEMAALSAGSTAQSAPSFELAPSAVASSSRAPEKRLAMREGSPAAANPQPAPIIQAPALAVFPVAPAVQTAPSLPGERAPQVPTTTVKTFAPAAAPPVLGKATPAPGDGLSEERLLAAAVRALRAQKDPRSALAALDEYRARYPQGRMQAEASVLRADTMTALKQPGETLRVLDGLDFSRMPGGLERRLQRGELRAFASRWREAEPDFSWAFAHARDKDTLERALWGRAQSRAHLGDRDGARSDAGEYLRRFSTGRFAAEAAQLGRAGE